MEREEIAEEQMPPTIGDVKNLALSKIVSLLFSIAELIFEGDAIKASQLMQNCFRLLPPDIRRDMKREEEEVEKIIHVYASINDPDLLRRSLLMRTRARKHLPCLLEILSEINRLLYERYLRTGYKGLDLAEAAKTFFRVKGDEEEP